MYDSESSSEAGWIDWFCDLEGHEFFVTVSTITYYEIFTGNYPISRISYMLCEHT